MGIVSHACSLYDIPVCHTPNALGFVDGAHLGTAPGLGLRVTNKLQNRFTGPFRDKFERFARSNIDSHSPSSLIAASLLHAFLLVVFFFFFFTCAHDQDMSIRGKDAILGPIVFSS